MRKILSIDGGGIKGVFAAAFLAEIEEKIDGTVGEYFDLIAGTSTGGIIGIGLGLGISARDLADFYKDAGPNIFEGNQWARFARRWVREKYDSVALRKALEEKFGDRRLGEAATRLLIPSQQLETGDIYIYKTAHHDDLDTDWRDPAVDVALATSAAPTFFPSTKTPRGPSLVDGGLWANNPVGLACVEAVGHRLRWSPGDVRILSISCTSSPLRRSRFRARGLTGVVGWGKPLLDMMSVGQSQGAVGIAKNLLGSANVLRIDRVVDRGSYALDDVRSIDSLIGLGYAEARRRAHDVIDGFFSDRAEPFEPCHGPKLRPRGIALS